MPEEPTAIEIEGASQALFHGSDGIQWLSGKEHRLSHAFLMELKDHALQYGLPMRERRIEGIRTFLESYDGSTTAFERAILLAILAAEEL